MCFNNQKFTPKSFAFFLFGKKKKRGPQTPISSAFLTKELMQCNPRIDEARGEESKGGKTKTDKI